MLRCLRRLLFALSIAFFGGPDLRACNVPVFRYALERWPAELFSLEVPPGTALPGLSALGSDGTLNLHVEEGAGSEARLLFPNAPDAPAWTGILTAAQLAALSDSPARVELVKRLLRGETAVWVLVESGSADDAALHAQLEQRLRQLESTLELPELNPHDPADRLAPGPALAIKFSTLRLRRDDPAEQTLIALLSGPNPTRRPEPGTTFVAPVFGRGHVLGVLPAAMVSEERIDGAGRFLTGACSCEVKELNPGWDLLLRVDWTAALQQHATAADAPATAPALETVKIEPAIAAAAATSSSPRWAWTVAALLVLAVAAFCGWNRDLRS